jgi:NACHT domain
LTTIATVDSIDERQRCKELDNKKKVILDWLSKKDFIAQHLDFIRKRYPGTGQWLLKSNNFQNWVDGSDQTLFCTGIPGAGKTVMTAIVVDELYSRFQNDSGIAIIYLYCSFRVPDTEEDMLLGLLKQLVQKQSSIADEVKSFHDRYKTQPSLPSVGEIFQVFQTVALLFRRIFIVVDALDEIQLNAVRIEFLSKIFHLQAQTGASLFTTSRRIPDITRMFEKSVRLEIRASDEDVGIYLDGCFSELPSFVQSSPSLKSEVKTAITNAVDGM